MKMDMNDVFIPDRKLKDISDFIDKNDNYIIFGTSALAKNIKNIIEGYYKTVVAFIEFKADFTDRYFEGLPVYELENLPLENLKIIIASYHQLEIARYLYAQYKLLHLNNYIFWDHLLLCRNYMFHDAIGREFYDYFNEHKDEFSLAYNCFSDNESKLTYKKLINYRLKALNPEKLLLNDFPVAPEVQKKYEKEADRYYAKLPQRIHHSLRKAIAYKISLNQYSYFNLVSPKKKKIIFNVGAYNNTSVMFLYYSPDGEIYAFEPEKDRSDENQELSKIYKNIIPINKGVWSSSGEIPFCSGNTFGHDSSSWGCDENASQKINVIAIDEFVNQNDVIPDYIKMDIEGAEIEALKGSRNLIKEYSPDLAISMYHTASQLHEIPLFIKELNNKYKIYVGHKYHNFSETVCFATVKSPS